MLKLNDIRFSYDGKKMILDGVRLHVDRGEIVAVLGSSGSGKSTLLSIIAGLEQPLGGTVILDGVDVTALPCEKRGVGLVFQDYALFPHLNVEKNVGFALKSHRDPLVEQMLRLVNMSAYRKRYPYQLSGGEKQRVAIARSLAARPKLLLLDEPFSNLDADLRKKVREDIRDILRRSKMTAVLVTHDIEDARAIADRVITIAEGRAETAVDKSL